ncbi:MAG TPA: glycosyl hydrolase [Streptosporangiaceae bacterium]
MRRSWLATLVMPVVAAAVTAGVLAGTHHTTVPSLSPSAPQPGRSAAGPPSVPCLHGPLPKPFTGIAINPQITAHVQAFRRATAAPINLVEFYNPFGQPFQRWEAAQAVQTGALPLIQLNPRHTPLAKIASGGYDPYLRLYADAVKAFRCQVVLSFGHEMNGWWYPWGLPETTPATFIAAWRHIHDVFAARHVTNVTWSWDPSHLYQHFRTKSASPASEWYPGNKYVDWVGVDGYLGPGQTFREIFAYQLHNIRSVTRKPVYLAETGVAGGPGQAGQIAQLFASLRGYRLTGLVWFDLNRKQPWRLEGRPAGIAAFRKAVAQLRH